MDEPIYRLPPDWQLSPAVTPLAEVVDPFQEFLGVADLQAKCSGWIGGAESRPLVYAVLDTGVDDKHKDLAGQVLEAADFSGSIWGPADRNGHGTHCAGMIAAAANDFGVRGIAPRAKLLCAKVLGDNGSGTDRSIGRGLDWAFKKGADVFSLSLGGPRMSEGLHSLFREVSQQPGKFIFAAAGNDGGSVNYPAAWDEPAAVGAVDADGDLTPFTSRGPELDILAPGVSILSTVPGNRHATMTGTSMATPIAAAIGGLLYGYALQMGRGSELASTKQMVEVLRRSSRDPAAQYPLIDPRRLAKAFEAGPGPVTAPPVDHVMVYAGGRAWKYVPAGV
jgi:subtilisin